MRTPFISPLAVSVTVTRPPPAVPSTVIWSSSACISCIFALQLRRLLHQAEEIRHRYSLSSSSAP